MKFRTDRSRNCSLQELKLKGFVLLKASITEFCQFIENELFVVNMSIDEYKLGTFIIIKSKESVLLLQKKNCKKFQRKLKDVG